MASVFESDFFKFLGKAIIVVGAIWSIFMGAKVIYDFAYDNAYKAFEQQINYFEMKIEDLKEKALVDSAKMNTLIAENTELRSIIHQLRTTNVILKDTLVYEGEAVSFLDGKVSIKCTRVRVVQEEWGIDRFANIGIDALGRHLRGGTFYSGDLKEFEYDNRIYILNVLGIREYEKGAGVRIAVYKK